MLVEAIASLLWPRVGRTPDTSTGAVSQLRQLGGLSVPDGTRYAAIDVRTVRRPSLRSSGCGAIPRALVRSDAGVKATCRWGAGFDDARPDGPEWWQDRPSSMNP